MNAFYEHHQNSIRFGYRCFDRILLNGLIQPFQQPERVAGFFSQYRNQYPVSRDVLREIADQFHNWVKNRSEKWGVPLLDAPQGRRDEFVEPYFRHAQPDQLVVILKAREPARILTAIGNKKDNRWHLQLAQRWVVPPPLLAGIASQHAVGGTLHRSIPGGSQIATRVPKQGVEGWLRASRPPRLLVV